MKEVFKGKFSTVVVDRLVAIGKSRNGIVTTFDNGCRNQTNYTAKDEFERDYDGLVEAFKRVHDGCQIFEGTFWVLRVDQIVEMAMDDKIGMYMTFNSGVREYSIYQDESARMKEYTEMGLMLSNKKED